MMWPEPPDAMTLSEEEARQVARLPTAYRERVLAIVGRLQLAAAERIRQAELASDCPYPKHPNHWGRMDHWRYLGTMDEKPGDPLSGMALEACEVCGTVRAHQAVAIASAAPEG